MGLSAGGAEVRRRIIERRYHKVACPASFLEKIDAITPLLRSGFDAAHKEAQAKARDEKAAWLDILAQNGEIDTALIFGTLKALPEKLPQTIAAHWLENGVVAQFREAA
ncbi:MAG: hypothetical protein Q4G39_05940 [Brachymonas sp.]|nr:hypothetical protein [Brachymonas sp.]